MFLLENKAVIIFVILLVFLSACKTDPPISPVFPDVMGCTISGDISLDFVSNRGFISTIQSERLQYQFSSIAKIENVEHAMVVSIFLESEEVKYGIFPIRSASDTNDSGTYAYAVFLRNYGRQDLIEYWADSGNVELDTIIIGDNRNHVKGFFNFEAVDKQSGKRVTISNGWVDMERKL